MLLAFDTGADQCSLALCPLDPLDQAPFLASRAMRRGQAEALLPMIADLMAAHAVARSDISHLAVTTGPGSFAGVRIGIAAARGLALALNLPLYGFGTLEVLAFAACDRRLPAAEALPILAAIAARGDQLYVQAYDAAGVAQADPKVSDGAAMARDYQGFSGLLVGSGAAALKAVLPHAQMAQTPAALAASLAALARHRIKGGAPGTRLQPPTPLYLRPPDATLSARPGLTHLERS
ncbi:MULTISPECIES: tRNA (adenosine(37)-N6)-threonylcarbamoyltransferase complex dimerization subunit type 1 TsaB [unclassified Iodidimonas]|uniref:tRNA (adenosine(37)-N6)-threonylcarbamoyltransferase complex dimerization subunit type 1 TsaB n=1 Tax=unclassified Iodidimonas TaxID=2626145 RepID=UPI002482911D|nr:MULTISPECIES: tRNA (adenosine(37)-N6)-threonylcarbamoyltransferase complex dimerization subunit type 1 TsaB [unclassified Iodidimonas]